ncbi:hypothetical protein EC991_009439 [Linnemannia zychae]|nr:hypothetical protein EC991_009439 [Linnemannia zychae]
MNPYLTTVAPPHHHFVPSNNGPLSAASSSNQQQHSQPQQIPQSQLSIMQRQHILGPQDPLMLEPFHQDIQHRRQQQQQQQQQQLASSAPFSNNTSNVNNAQQQQQQQQQAYASVPNKQNWDILTGPNAIDHSMTLQIGSDGSLLGPRWDTYDLGNLPPVQIAPRAKNISLVPRPAVDFDGLTPHTSLMMQRPLYFPSPGQGQQPQQQQPQPQQQQHRQQSRPQQELLAVNGNIFTSSSTVPTISDMGVLQQQQQHHNSQQQQQQKQMNASPAAMSGYLQTSCSPEMPIKASPVEQQLSWTSWEDTPTQQQQQQQQPQHEDIYATPCRTHTSFDDGPREDIVFSGTKTLEVFTSSKKDDNGEFRKGQQFYLNIQLNKEDRERYRYLRIPTENIVLPCRADAAGRIGLNASGKRSADAMSAPTSMMEEDVLALKLTTYLEPEHRVVVPCGRCKDKTPEILRFHPGVNGKPMIDENGMVALRDGHVKLIASAWCASTSHHRGPGTKFSFNVELSSHNHYQAEPLLIYEGRSDEVEIYASHGRDKGARLASKLNEKASKSSSPAYRDQSGPPSPAKTASSSPPNSPSALTGQYESGPGPLKKRREEAPMTPPMVETDMPPTIKSLEPRKGPICRENHVIIIGSNFTRGMVPMFGREYGTVVDINPYYIECTTPRYPNTETVQIWLYHNENYMPTDKTYEFTDEQAQSDMEQLLRNLIQDGGEGGDAGSYLSLLERIAGLPPSTDISGQSQSNGSSMLHNSVMMGYQAGLNILIEEGIELDLEDDTGFTALDYAVFANNVEATEALLQAGAMLSIEHLTSLKVQPSAAMSTLLRSLCGLELSEPTPEITVSAEVYDVGALLQGATLDSADDDDDASFASSGSDSELDDAPICRRRIASSTSLSILASSPPPFSSSAPTSHFEQGRHHQSSRSKSSLQRKSRPSSIATQSTGMMSLAPTMSTLALSATSSAAQSHGSVGGIVRQASFGAKGGQENIWQCAKKGNLALVKFHLNKDPQLINAPWRFDGRAVLSSACASRQPLELVEFLAQRGAQINSADTFKKRTALHTLCEEGGLCQDDWALVAVSQADQDANDQDVIATMRFLLDHGAAVDAKNHWKETPLMRLLAGRDCPLMVQELYSRGADSRLKPSKDAYPRGTALCYAAFYGRIKSLKWMIENDLLLNDEASIKDAIRWAKASKSGDMPHNHSQATATQSANVARRKEERKTEAIRLLEGWLGENGASRRKALAKEISAQQSEGWFQRMSGIVKVEDTSSSAPVDGDNDADITGRPASPSSKLPAQMVPLWKDVQSLSDSLVQGSLLPSSPSNRIKWNPLTMLRK